MELLGFVNPKGGDPRPVRDSADGKRGVAALADVHQHVSRGMVYNPRPPRGSPVAGKRRKRKSGRKAKVSRITKLAPSQPAARDEGPRLIPLRKAQDGSKIDHWVELADKALGGPTKRKGAGQE